MVKIKTAKANPTKAFFVRMITRDISLEDCILDLIDNSVDGAWEKEGSRPMFINDQVDLSEYKIDIEFSQDQFRIIDNCGGISLDKAAEYAFTFGRKEKETHENYSIGVYGIGMKRAIFKMGTRIEIRSTYKENDGKREAFLVPIDVKKWLKGGETEHWDFDIEDATKLSKDGVEIIIKKLLDATSSAFGSPEFIQNLKRTLERDYAIHLHRGLKISLNGKKLKGWEIEFQEGKDFAPMRVQYAEQENGGEVSVEILAGMASQPSEDADADDRSKTVRRSGWYVICNGRIVLAADQSTDTGWGTSGWPIWHPQYSGFMGLIFFSSENAGLLPITTTKRNVDQSSNVFRRALPKMRNVTKEWVSYTSVRKQNLDEAKKLEVAVKAKPIFALDSRANVVLPKLTPKPKVLMANIAYSVTKERFQKVADELGNINMSYREAGIKTFDYVYSDLVGED